MQTFITSSRPNFGVDNLDTKRIVKQHLENRQILNAIAGHGKGWHNHPAVKMWAIDPAGFLTYCRAVKVEMKKRHFAWENNWGAIVLLVEELDITAQPVSAPWWIDPQQKDRIITTHRASLYAKDPQNYAQWEYERLWVDSYRYASVCCTQTKKVCNYYWPTHQEA